MKTSILIVTLGLFTALNALAAVTQAGSYDSFQIDVAGAKPVSVQLSAESDSCGATDLLGEMRPIPAAAESEVRVIYMDYSAYGNYRACNPFVPPEKRVIKTAPLTIQPAPGVERVQLIVPAGFRVELVP